MNVLTSLISSVELTKMELGLLLEKPLLKIELSTTNSTLYQLKIRINTAVKSAPIPKFSSLKLSREDQISTTMLFGTLMLANGRA